MSRRTRSSQAFGASQAYPQSQAAQYEEEEEVRMEGTVSDEENEKGLQLKAAALVRLALACEHRRTPLRREEISKKVLTNAPRSFGPVFQQAQKILRQTFGMELIELRARPEADDTPSGTQAARDGDPDETRKAALKKKQANAGSKTYILRSILDPLLIEHAAISHEAILEAEQSSLNSTNGNVDSNSQSDDDDQQATSQSFGTILSWQSGDALGLASLGVLHTILAVILVSGRYIADSDLRSTLRRLRIPLGNGSGAASGASIPLPNRSTVASGSISIDALLAQFVRHGFLERATPGGVIASAKGKTSQKRGRGAGATQENGSGEQPGWRWGSRAYAEIGEAGVGKWVAEFLVEREADAEGERPQEERVNRVLKGIERAAGGNLAGVTEA